jgi:hypothetical protein
MMGKGWMPMSMGWNGVFTSNGITRLENVVPTLNPEYPEVDMKKVYIIAVLVIITVLHVLVIRQSQHRKESNALEEYQPPSNVAIDELLGKQIDHLKTLSVKETVQQLDRQVYYDYPGAFAASGLYVIWDGKGDIFPECLYKRNRAEVEVIMSSRMFRKSLQDLEQLPRDEASKLLVSELDGTLSKYLELYNGFWKTKSLDVSSGELPDGPPTLPGIRNKLFALVLIAGTLKFTDIHEKVKEIDDIAKNQEIEVRRIEDRDVKTHYMMFPLLHNNIVLASGLYGTSTRKGDSDLKLFADRFADHKLVDFSAPGTEYDVMVTHGVQALMPDKEYINVCYFDQMTYEDLDELHNILGSL